MVHKCSPGKVNQTRAAGNPARFIGAKPLPQPCQAGEQATPMEGVGCAHRRHTAIGLRLQQAATEEHALLTTPVETAGAGCGARCPVERQIVAKFLLLAKRLHGRGGQQIGFLLLDPHLPAQVLHQPPQRAMGCAMGQNNPTVSLARQQRQVGLGDVRYIYQYGSCPGAKQPGDSAAALPIGSEDPESLSHLLRGTSRWEGIGRERVHGCGGDAEAMDLGFSSGPDPV